VAAADSFQFFKMFSGGGYKKIKVFFAHDGGGG
jgi:hypothetical protein